MPVLKHVRAVAVWPRRARHRRTAVVRAAEPLLGPRPAGRRHLLLLLLHLRDGVRGRGRGELVVELVVELRLGDIVERERADVVMAGRF